MSPGASSAAYDRVYERRGAVALARHFREAEGLSIAQIADRLGRSPATVKAYFYDPTGEKARAVKARYRGVCRGCGGYTQPRNWQGRRIRVLQGVPSRRDSAALDPATRGRRDVRMARTLRSAALLLRLVADTRPAPRRSGARATESVTSRAASRSTG
jgi:AraC-like DNA-binding protein